MQGYLTVTELPGNKASKEQIERLYHRYHFALSFCQGKDVLEVACGAGMGLGYLRKVARKVVGGDVDEDILEFARKYYREQKAIECRKLDAHHLPFPDKSFNVMIMYEAIYYLRKPEKFILEASRVLKEGGVLLISTVNKDWSDFNPSPFASRYFSALELYQLLSSKFRDVKLYGAFAVQANSMKAKIISLIKRMAVKFHFIPKTMKGKEFFKRIFFGRLISMPFEVTEGLAEYVPPAAISKDSPDSQFKVIYAVARI